VKTMRTIQPSQSWTLNTTMCIERSSLDWQGCSHGVLTVTDGSSPTWDVLGQTDDMARYGYVKAFGLTFEIVLVEGRSFAMLHLPSADEIPAFVK